MLIFITVFGGLGLFLYGMNIMAEGLQKSAGNKLRTIIGKLTTNKFKGLLVGTLVTMIIQSSSATTVMVVGFINAGIMNLNQAVGIIMGANIGTTITGQLIAFNLSDYAPLAIGIGVFIWLFTKDNKTKNIAEIILGFGLLFLGLDTMSNGLSPLANSKLFSDILIKLENPFLGMLAGFLLTTVVQSSSASIGILQVLAGKDLIPTNIALSVLYGDNIGTTTTSLISSIGTKTAAKRAALLHFLFNVIGTIIFMTVMNQPCLKLVVKLTPDNRMRQIANAHTFFNLFNVLIQLPFSNYLVRIVEKLIPEKEEEVKEVAKYLDPRLLKTPSIALEQMKKELIHMGEISLDNLKDVKELICFGDSDKVENIMLREDDLDKLEDKITEFGVALSNESLSAMEKAIINVFLDVSNNIERVGDHVENISEYISGYDGTNPIKFSKYGEADTIEIFDDTIKILDMAIKSFQDNNYELALEVRALEEQIDMEEKKYKESHVKRLNDGTCSIETGLVFLGTINNLERIADHSFNISRYVEDAHKDGKNIMNIE